MEGQQPLFITPSEFQPELPIARHIIEGEPGPEAVDLDVVFVGGGPAGLAGAIELSRLAQQHGGSLKDLEIGVLEKAQSVGEHCLSGAVIVPSALFSLFPDLAPDQFPFRGKVDKDQVYVLTERGKVRIPTPATMRNEGNFVVSICELVRWMAARAEDRGVNIFTGFPAASLFLRRGRVTGVRTAPSGLTRNRTPGPAYSPPTDIRSRIAVLAEGTRGGLTHAYLTFSGIKSQNPQIFALGVKELWETSEPLPGVIHTLGWPLPRDTFGGGWIYPMGENLVSFGLVVGLDYSDANLDVHELVQQYKSHPLLNPWIKSGKVIEWGAKTIPEGGYHSLPERFTGDGIVIVGDSAGFVNVASLKGIHYAIQSGIFAARAIFSALKDERTDAAALKAYDTMVRSSFIADDLFKTRNMRLAFKKGFWRGGIEAAVMEATGGKFPGKAIRIEDDAHTPKRVASLSTRQNPDGLRKLDAVYLSGNVTRDDIPSHLIPAGRIPPEVAKFYEHMCPAGVYESRPEGFVINPPNCIDCKATDVLGPRWTVREGGSGPRYRQM